MKRILHAAVALLLIAGAPAPGLGADPKEPEHCVQLLTILKTAADRIVQGDFSNKVRVALAAHERLGCNANGLLDVLKIRRPQPAQKTTQ